MSNEDELLAVLARVAAIDRVVEAARELEAAINVMKGLVVDVSTEHIDVTSVEDEMPVYAHVIHVYVPSAKLKFYP